MNTTDENKTESKQKKQSNDFIIISIIFVFVICIWFAYNYASGQTRGLPLSYTVGQLVLPSLFFSVVPYYIYRGIVAFIKGLKED